MTVDLVEDKAVTLLKYVTTKRTCMLVDFMKEGASQRIAVSEVFANLLNSAIESIEANDDF